MNTLPHDVGRPLQILCIASAIENLLPDCVDSGLFPVPENLVHPALHYALALYSTSIGVCAPALPARMVFAALRRSTFTSFDLLSVPNGMARAVLATLSTEQIASILGSLLTGSSQRCVFDKIAVSTSHIASARALHLLLIAVARAADVGCLTHLEIVGVGTTKPVLWPQHVHDITGFIRARAMLRVLRLCAIEAVSDDNVAELVHAAGPKLHELDLSMTAVTGAGLSAALEASGNGAQVRETLVCLRVTATDVDSASLVCLVGMEALEELGIGWTLAVRPDGTTGYSGFEPMSASAAIDAASLHLSSYLSFSSLPSLRQLDMSGATIDLPRISPAITNLVLNRATVSHMFNRRFPIHLEHLDMSLATGSNALVASLIFDFEVTPLTLASSLRSVNLAGSDLSGWGRGDEDTLLGPGLSVGGGVVVHDVSQSDVCVWFGHMQALRELDVSSTNLMSPAALAAILSSGCADRVEVLRLRKIRRPSFVCTLMACLHINLGLSRVHFSALTELDISESELGRDEAELDAFLALCSPQRMQKLRTSGAMFVGDTVARRAVARFGKNVKEMDLSCTAITSSFLCPLHACGSDDDDAEIRRGGEESSHAPLLPVLERVDLRGCKLVDHEDMSRSIALHAPALIHGTLDHEGEPDTVLVVGENGLLAARGRRIIQSAARRQVSSTPEWRRKDRSRVSF
jgi:hypothetical protein